jgi:hypothetical protein
MPLGEVQVQWGASMFAWSLFASVDVFRNRLGVLLTRHSSLRRDRRELWLTASNGLAKKNSLTAFRPFLTHSIRQAPGKGVG